MIVSILGKKKKPSHEKTYKVLIKSHHDKNGGHPHIILEDIENKHVSVGLSTRATKGANSTKKNYKCQRNPLGGSETSYMRRQGTVAPKYEYGSFASKGYLTSKDYTMAKSIGSRAKSKYLSQKKKK